MKHLTITLLTLLISGSLWTESKELYLECEAEGNLRNSTAWVNNSCQITKKSKHYYEIKDDYWKVIYRKTNQDGKFHKLPDGNRQLCGDKVEPFQTILKRAKTKGKAFDYDWYEGATRSVFFEEHDSDNPEGINNKKPVIYEDREIKLYWVTGKALKKEFQKVSLWGSINRLTGNYVNSRNKINARCEPITKDKFLNITNGWEEGYSQIVKAELSRRKF